MSREQQPDRERCGFRIQHGLHEFEEDREMYRVSKNGRADYFTPDQMSMYDGEDDATFDIVMSTALGLPVDHD